MTALFDFYVVLALCLVLARWAVSVYLFSMLFSTSPYHTQAEKEKIATVEASLKQLRLTIINHQRECFRVKCLELIVWLIGVQPAVKLSVGWDLLLDGNCSAVKATLADNDRNLLSAFGAEDEMSKAHCDDVEIRKVFIDELEHTVRLVAKTTTEPKTKGKKDRLDTSTDADYIKAIVFLQNAEPKEPMARTLEVVLAPTDEKSQLELVLEKWRVLRTTLSDDTKNAVEKKLKVIVDTELWPFLELFRADEGLLLPDESKIPALKGIAKETVLTNISKAKKILQNTVAINCKDLEEFASKHATSFAHWHMQRWGVKLVYDTTKEITKQHAMLAPKIMLLLRNALQLEDTTYEVGETLEGSLEIIIKKTGGLMNLREKKAELAALLEVVLPKDFAEQHPGAGDAFQHLLAKVANVQDFVDKKLADVVAVVANRVRLHLIKLGTISTAVGGFVDRMVGEEKVDIEKLAKYVLNDKEATPPENKKKTATINAYITYNQL